MKNDLKVREVAKCKPSSCSLVFGIENSNKPCGWQIYSRLAQTVKGGRGLIRRHLISPAFGVIMRKAQSQSGVLSPLNYREQRLMMMFRMMYWVISQQDSLKATMWSLFTENTRLTFIMLGILEETSPFGERSHKSFATRVLIWIYTDTLTPQNFGSLPRLCPEGKAQRVKSESD